MCCSEEVTGQFVVAGSDTPPIFKPTKEVLDFVPAAIDTLGAEGLLNSITAAGNNGQRAVIVDLLPHGLAVVSLVSSNGLGRNRRL